MTVSQKASLSLLISVVLFAAFTVISFMGLFDLVEARFYNPSITKNVTRELQQDSRTIQDFLRELESRFSATIQNDAVRRSFLPNQSAEDIFERSKLYGTLMESLGGLQSIRFVDAAGKRIHYSTLQSDVLNQDRLSISYRNYDELNEPFSYDDLSVPNRGATKLTLDSGQDRIIFSLPFYDSYNVYRGSAFFSVSVRAVSDRLLSEGHIKYGEDVSVLSDPAGIIIGMPRGGKEALLSAVSSVWREGITALTPLDSAAGDFSFGLISVKADQGIYVGLLVDEKLFEFPFAMKLILLVSFFLTTYLIIFLLFNLRQDSMTVMQNRLKRLQIMLFEEYYNRKGDMDWSRWSRELEQRREEVRNELKRGINIRKGSQSDLDIDTLIDKSWEEMAAVMGSREHSQLTANIDEEKLSSILNKVLAAAGNAPAGEANQPRSGAKTAAQPIAAGEPEEVLEELDDDAEEVLEELDDSAEVMAEDLEELDEDGDSAAVEELEDLDDAAEDSAEDLEELDDAGESAAVEELEDLDDAAEASAEDLEEFDDAGEDGIEDLEELNDDAAPDSAEVLEDLDEPGIESAAADSGEGEALVEDLEELDEDGASGEPETLEELDEDGEVPGSERKKQSNIRLAFGDDDIPYIVETSGLELVDEDADAVINMINQNDQPSDLEELDEVEDLENLDDEDDEDTQEPKTKRLSEEDISKLASEIEFNTPTLHDEYVEDQDFEIFSPFDNIFIENDTSHEETPGDAPTAELEDVNPSFDMSVVYKPFQDETTENPQELEAVENGNDSAGTEVELEEIPDEPAPPPEESQDDAVIEERNGINYIKDSNIKTDTNGKSLDPEFKDLVDSVLKKDQ